jgi:hypothetical protein
MAPPALQGSFAFPSGLIVFETLWDLTRLNGQTLRLPPGRYSFLEAGRWFPAHHRYSDGYYYEVRVDGGLADDGRIIGYQWQDRIASCIDVPDLDLDGVEEELDQDDAPVMLIEGCDPQFTTSQVVPLRAPLPVWPGLPALQAARCPDPVEVLQVEVIDIAVHAPIDAFLQEDPEIDFDETVFYVYHIRLPDKSRRWTTEEHLSSASSATRSPAETSHSPG